MTNICQNLPNVISLLNIYTKKAYLKGKLFKNKVKKTTIIYLLLLPPNPVIFWIDLVVILSPNLIRT